jgi:hypothetical protein
MAARLVHLLAVEPHPSGVGGKWVLACNGPGPGHDSVPGRFVTGTNLVTCRSCRSSDLFIRRRAWERESAQREHEREFG